MGFLIEEGTLVRFDSTTCRAFCSCRFRNNASRLIMLEDNLIQIAGVIDAVETRTEKPPQINTKEEGMRVEAMH